MEVISTLCISFPWVFSTLFFFIMYIKAILRIFKVINANEKIEKSEAYIFMHFMMLLFYEIGWFIELITSIFFPHKILPNIFRATAVFLSNLSLAIILLFSVCRF